MRAGLAPVVILVEERAAYMDLLARSDYDGLAAMLRRLSERKPSVWRDSPSYSGVWRKWRKLFRLLNTSS